MPTRAVGRLSRPVVAALLSACAVAATASNLPQAVPLIALSALSAIACVAPQR